MMRQMVTESIKAATESSGAMKKIRDKLKEFYADNVLFRLRRIISITWRKNCKRSVRQFGWADSLMKDKVEELRRKEDISEKYPERHMPKPLRKHKLVGRSDRGRPCPVGRHPQRYATDQEQIELIYDMQSRVGRCEGHPNYQIKWKRIPIGSPRIRERSKRLPVRYRKTLEARLMPWKVLLT